MNHLTYITFGEQDGSVYDTQVKQLLNYWIKRDNWKVTLIQIADAANFNGLDSDVEQIYLKRKLKVLFSIHKKKYVQQINKLLSIDNKDNLFFNSRGGTAYSIVSNYINTYDINYKCNNLDVRGTIEEFKFSKTRRFLYPFFNFRTNRILKGASSVTTVTDNLKNHLLQKQNILKSNIKIQVVPTLSILEYKPNKDKKNIAYIGKIAWIDPKAFVDQILRINNLFLEKDWYISIIGNSSGTFGLEKHHIRFIDRMTPIELEKKISDYHTGLVLRDSSIVNQVAAPCKISDYLCLGMPVIYSGEIGSLKDFLNLFPECKKFIMHIDQLDDSEKILSHTNIKDEDMKFLSEKAQSYFGVQSVIDRYIEFFNS